MSLVCGGAEVEVAEGELGDGFADAGSEDVGGGRELGEGALGEEGEEEGSDDKWDGPEDLAVFLEKVGDNESEGAEEEGVDGAPRKG